MIRTSCNILYVIRSYIAVNEQIHIYIFIYIVCLLYFIYTCVYIVSDFNKETCSVVYCTIVLDIH